MLARFVAERQALALMDHPGIAKMLDGGVTEQGQPFFVMELVRGLPITKFCDQEKLSLDQRLGLFVQVSQAVHHAPPEGGHPPRSQALQHSGKPAGRQAGGEGD